MRRALLLASVALVASGSTDAQSGATALPAHINTMLMYDYDALATRGWTTGGVSRNLSELLDGFDAAGLPGLFRIDTRLFTGGGHEPGNLTLVPDWEAQLDAAFAAARPHLREGGALRGFFIGDELTAQGLPFADLKAVVDAVRDGHPGVVTRRPLLGRCAQAAF
jgi:hypothetical protein